MPDEKLKCPSCDAEIEPDSLKCPKCGIGFGTGDAPNLDLKKESKGLVRLMSLSDSIEAHMVRMFLEDAGIPCVVSEGGVTSYFGASSPFPLTKIKILVPQDRAKDAVIAMQKYNKWDEKQLDRYLTMLDEIE